jgi:hypothetical protein
MSAINALQVANSNQGVDYDRNAGAGPVAIAADYLETVIIRK